MTRRPMKMMRAVWLPAVLLAATALAAGAPPAAAAAPAPAPAPSPWRLRSEISFVKTSGNTDTETFAGKVEAAWVCCVHKFYLNGQYVYGRNSGRQDSNRLALDGRWEAALNGRVSGIVSLGYGRDQFSGYRYRVFVGPGLGYYLLKDKKRSLQLLLALNYYHDRFSVGEREQLRSLTARSQAKLEWRPLGNFRFVENLGHLLSLGEAGRAFVDSETAIETRINKTLSIGVSYKINYQSRPPAAEIRRIDTTFLTALIIDVK